MSTIKKMKVAELKNLKKGFTLIELLVVIAVIGIMAAVLITVIDPIDKINTASDTGVISTIEQIGKANDAYATTHNATYVGGATVNAALTDLVAAGETKLASYAPTGYTVNYATTASCTTAGANCLNYAVWVSALKGKKYVNGTPPAAGPIYVWANGQGCYKASGTTITAATTCP